MRTTMPVLLLATAVAALFVAAAAPAQAPELALERVDAATPNGPVNVLERAGERLYVAGGFDRVGPRRGGGAEVDAGSGGLAPSGPRFGLGAVTSVIPDGAGGWYAGGTFRDVGGTPRFGVVRLTGLGAVEPAFDARVAFEAVPAPQAPNAPPPPVPRIADLLLAGGRLYVAGTFTTVGGRSRSQLAALDPASGALLEAFDPGADGVVDALAAGPGRIYAGGRFGRIGGGTRTGLAALDPATGALVAAFDPSGAAWPPPPSPPPAEGSPPPPPAPRPADVTGGVRDLVLAGGRLLLGGEFTAVGGVARNRLAAVDAGSGALDRGFDPSADGTVEALALDAAGRLYAGGSFRSVAGRPAISLARLDASSGAADATFAPALAAPVTAIAPAGDRVLLAGGGRTAGHVALPSAVALQAADGAVDTAFAPQPIGGSVLTVAAQQGRAFLGGAFGQLGGDRRRRLAALDAASGRLDAAFAPELEGSVVDARVAGGRVYVITAEGRRQRLVALDARTGRVVTAFRARSLRETVALAATTRGPCSVSRSRSRRGRRLVTVSRLRCFDRAGRERRRLRRTLSGSGYRGASLAVGGGTLILWGSFERVGETARRSLAGIDLRTGRLTALRARGVGDIEDLTVEGGRAYMIAAAGSGRRVLALSPLTGAPVRGFAGPRVNGGRLAASGGRLVVLRNRLVQQLGRDGTVLGQAPVRGDVLALAGATLYVGRRFGADEEGSLDAFRLRDAPAG